MPAVPTIETDRTVLREHRVDDFESYAAFWADPVVTRFIGGKPRSREDSWVRILRYAGMWRLIGYGLWVVEEKATGRLVGEAGFHELRRDIEPSFEGMPEAGWAFLPSVHGTGIASEVMLAAHDWAKGKPDFATTVAIIDPDNAASLKLAAKLGYREKARATYHGEATILLQR